MANDCSERICQFGLAHVDTPKGDIDSSSGELYSPEALTSNGITPGSRVATPIIVDDAMYPKGTWELYPNMVDTRNTVLDNTAHDYMECSNKGYCDRTAGTCVCFEGYDGSACQRASCPTSTAGFCSGHGMCATVKEIARFDYNNSYNLWDEYSTMGCLCDYGWEGPDCSKKMCKIGIDPLYYDDEVNARFSNFTFVIWNIDTPNDVKDHLVVGSKDTTVRRADWVGNFSIVFYDVYGQDWHTEAIDIFADCDEIRTAVESLPNDVIEAGSVRCSMDTGSFGSYANDDGSYAGTYAGTSRDDSVPPVDGLPITLDDTYFKTKKAFGPFIGTKFTLVWPSNPGNLRQPEIDLYLDGTRRTLSVIKPPSTAPSTDLSTKIVDLSAEVRTWVYPNGISGENFDFVPDLCLNVRLTISRLKAGSNWGKFNDLSDAETKLLMKCLGDSNGNPKDNNLYKASDTQDSLYNWDYGITDTDSNFKTKSSFSFDSDYVVNPHLVKLVDTSTKSATRLCNSANSKHQFTGADEITFPGYCLNPDPPGFYVVVYFDPRDRQFVFMSRSFMDFATTTEFYVFTTTGTLQLASTATDVFTNYIKDTIEKDSDKVEVADLDLIDADLSSMYSSVVYTLKADMTDPRISSNHVDCETAGATVLQCIEKGDYVMIFDTVDSKSLNPKYPNIYQVMKISKENSEAASDNFRYQIQLDMSMNARYVKTDAKSSNARIFKFTPPSPPVTYVGQCSLRGVCDSTNGLCTCFSGYTGDDCSVMNALAK